MNTYDLSFETELFYDFFTYYDQLSQLFYCFPLPGGQIGIHFINVTEAEEFKAKIRVFSPKSEFQKTEESMYHDIEQPGCFISLKSSKKSKNLKSKSQQLEISHPYAVQLIGRVI